MEHISGHGETVNRAYAVAFVEDDALHDTDWVFIDQGDCLVFVIKRHAITPATLAEAWATFRALEVQAA